MENQLVNVLDEAKNLKEEESDYDDDEDGTNLSSVNSSVRGSNR